MMSELKNILGSIEDIYLRLPVADIKEEHQLIADLGMDSLSRMSLFIEINIFFGREHEQENRAVQWLTVKDILDYMEGI